jgi:hypothetical protein
MTASTNFDKFTEYLAKGQVAFGTDTIKFLLVATAPTTSEITTWANRSDVTNECATSGTYSNGVGGSVTPVVALDNVLHRTTVTMSSPQAFTGATLSAVGAIIYKVSGVAATDKLIAYVDFGGTVVSTAGTFSTVFTTPLNITR